MGVTSKKSSNGMSKEAGNSQVKEHTDTTVHAESKKRSGDEIDEIFATKKKTKVVKNVKGKSVNDKKNNGVSKGPGDVKHKLSTTSGNRDGKEKRSNKLSVGGDMFGDSSKPRKKMSGLKIYTEEELGFNKADAGGTPLCPFDCDCCF